MRVALALCALLLVVPVARAATEVPLVLTQQGRLLDGADQPVSGVKHVTFALFDTDNPNTHAAVWQEAQDVTFDAGAYSVVLGDTSEGHAGTAIDDALLSRPTLYLSMTVDGTELLPRLRVTSAPYALRAGRAGEAETVLDGGVATGALQDQAVTTAKLADGAVTLAKLALTDGKFVGLDADTLDGLDSSAFAPASIEGTVDAIKTSTDLLPDLSTTAGAIHDDTGALRATLGAPATASLAGDVAQVAGAVAGADRDLTNLAARLGSPASTTVSADVAALASQVSSLTSQVGDLSKTLATLSQRQLFDDDCADSDHGGWPSRTACLGDGRWHTVFLNSLTSAGVSTPAQICAHLVTTLQNLGIAPEGGTGSGPQGAYWEVRFGYDSSGLPYHGEWHTHDDVNLDLYDSSGNLVEWTDNYSVGYCNIAAPGSYGWNAFIEVRK